MTEPSNESLAIERSLLELYEPNEHAPSMSAFDILRDLAKRSVTMQDALSEKVLSRQRLGKRLRQPLEEALRRVALTYSDVHIEDDGHGAWVVSGLQQRPQTDLHTAAPSSSTDSVGRSLASTGDEHLPSRGNSSSHVGPKRARLAKPEAEILQPATKFQWKGQTYEIDRHDSMQSTPAKQYYHLRRDGKPLGSSYARDRHWIVAEQPTSLLEESLLGFVSTVVDWGTIGAWGDETVCRGWGATRVPNPPKTAALPPLTPRRPLPRAQKREVERFISRTDDGHTTPLNLVWEAPHAMAVEFRNGGGRVALTIGCFGVVRSGHVRFSVCGTRVRDEWQQRALGELLVRRLEVAVLGKCADLHATSVEMTLPGGQCHLRVASLLMYSKCGWQISHRSKEAVSSERLRGLVVARKLEVLDEAHAEYPRRDVGTALEPAKAAAAKAMRKAIARAQVQYSVDSPSARPAVGPPSRVPAPPLAS